jgi:hypothetical protein
MWNRRAILIYPIDAFDAPRKTAVAQAFVTHAALETLANELLMFDKAAPVSGDYGATETHRQSATAMTPTLADAVKTALAGVSGYWYLLDADTDALLDTNDAAKADHGLDYEVGVNVVAGEILRFEGGLIEVLQNHQTAIQWHPFEAVSLYRRYRAPGEVHEWTQPTHAENSWPLNARVSHAGTVWKSLIPANTTEPGTQGGAQFWQDENAPQTPEWSGASVPYIGFLNDPENASFVLRNGTVYRCQMSHTSQPAWAPDAPGMTAIWQLQP